jgi:uncharacterized membrane protein
MSQKETHEEVSPFRPTYGVNAIAFAILAASCAVGGVYAWYVAKHLIAAVKTDGVALLYRAVAYLCLGITAEVVFTGIKALRQRKDVTMPGYTTLWMVPIYFFGLPLGFETLHDAIAGANFILRGAAYATGILVVEYVAATLLLAVIKKNPWEYAEGWHIQGKIRVDRFPHWMLFGLIVERLHTFLLAHVIP